ncbi:MAG: R3H domain-containing nucleic acid-binding protein [bacterium]
MEDFKEFVGSTLEEAKEKARDYFNSNHIEYELLPPKFMTMITGKRDIRIKAKIKEISEEYISMKQKSKELLDRILKEGNFAVSTSETMQDDAIRYILSGEDTAMFTEDKGKLLDSIQHILVKSVNKNTEKGGINIVVDADDFKKEREDYIKSYATKICTTVRKTNRPYILKPLNPSERRLVHILVKAEGDLTSESLGDGLYKKVKISKLAKPNGNVPNSEE